jgi:hypothetical protein
MVRCDFGVFDVETSRFIESRLSDLENIGPSFFNCEDIDNFYRDISTYLRELFIMSYIMFV